MNVIFFDWDDTLLPMSYLSEVVRFECSEEEWHTVGVAPHSRSYQLLREHAQRIRHTLRAARKVARVAIVTLAARPWIDVSAKRCLPGADLGNLLSELEIPVLYAREYMPHYYERQDDDR